MRQGQTLGTVGDTGSLGGARLYFEVRHQGKPVDPLAVAETARLTRPRRDGVETASILEASMNPIRHMSKVMMVSALLLVLTLSLGGGWRAKSNDPSATYENLRLFTEVLSIVQSQYVDEVPAKDIVYSAIKGTLRGLDPHSSFLDPEMYREMQVETTGSFGGLGIEITLRDDILTVVAPIDGTPGLPRRHPARRPHREDRGPVHQGHAAHRRGQADARQARHQDHDHDRARGLDGAEGLRDHPRADPGPVGAQPGDRARASSTSACASSRSRPPRTWRPRSRSSRRTASSRAWCSTCATTRAAS